MITRWLVRRLDDRLRFSPLARTGLNKVFPDHWSFMMGEIALYAFMYLVLSGVFLTMYFEPSTASTTYEGGYPPLHGSETSSAYASAIRLSWDVRLGLVMRQSHHWAALLFTGAIVVHMCRIFFTGAFRKPREINWLVGLTLMLLAFGNGFLGYSLPDDLLSATGLRVANGILLSIPVIGNWASFLFFGGEFPAETMIPRLYILHVLIVPGLILALVSVHMIILIRQKHSQFPGPGRRDTNVVGSRLWPGYAVRSIGLMFATFAAALTMGGLFQINPIWLWGPFEPGSATAPAQPDWYVGWVDGALRLWPAWEPDILGYRLPTLFLPGLVLPGLTFVVLYLWPWLDRLVSKDRRGHQVLERPRDRPGRTAFGVGALAFYLLLLFSFSLDVIARYTGIPVFTLVYTLRIGVVVTPFVVGAIAFVLARGLRDSGAEHLLEMGWPGVRLGLRRHRPTADVVEGQLTPEQTEPPPRERPERRPEQGLRPEEFDHLPVETGPVP